MDSATLMSGVAGVWSGLERLQATDPTEYKRVVRESLAWGEAAQSLPQPALCVQMVTKAGVQVQSAAVVVVVCGGRGGQVCGGCYGKVCGGCDGQVLWQL